MRLLAAALLLALSAAVPARALDITACPAVVPPGEVGVIQGDFVCAGGSSENQYFSIVLQRGARLDLNGHTLTYLQDSTTIGPVNCESKCEVNGPGTLTTPGGGAGIWIENRGRASVHDLAITGFHTGISAPAARLTLANTSIDASHFGILAARRVFLDQVDITLAGGPFGGVGGVGECIGASQTSGRVTGNDVTVSGCFYGVYGTRRVEISGLTVSGSYIGIFSAGSVVLTDATVTGSEYADIYSGRPPELTNSSCDQSVRWLRHIQTAGGPWGVCAND
jgi:hypothetical protein